MPRSSSPPANTRSAILAAALQLFGTKGYFNTSVHDIGGVAGVSIGSMYHHFGDKEGIARALYEALSSQIEDLIQAALGWPATCHDQAREVVAGLFLLTEEDPLAMEFMLYAKHREFLPDQPPVCSSRPFELMRNLVRRGMDEGEIRRMDPMVASTSLFGGPIRMITARLDGLLDQPLDAYLDETWTCAWRSVAA